MCLVDITDRKGSAVICCRMLFSYIYIYICYCIHSDIQADIFADTGKVEMLW
jgi:hypothetical protein